MKRAYRVGRIRPQQDADVETLLHGTGVSRRRALTIKWQNRMGHVYPRAIEMVRAGRIRFDAITTHAFPLDRAPDAFRFQNAYQEGVLKTMVEVG